MARLAVLVVVAVAISAASCGDRTRASGPDAGSGAGAGEAEADGREPASRSGIRLSSPVECPQGARCMIRNFVDAAPGPEARDYTCGRLTYDGHDGTDIRVPDGAALMKGVPVLAAADGVVVRVRDGMPDASIHGKDWSSLGGKDAGNSVVIDHGGEWETQYSHLREASVAVRIGDVVEAGSPLGLMGLSGRTEFVHLHFEVRYRGKAVDPYTGLEAAGAGCGAAGGEGLWADDALGALAYAAEAVMDAGFATSKRPDAWEVRAGAWASVAPAPHCEALVFWVDVVGARPGDTIEMKLTGPDGEVIAERGEVVADASVSQFRFLGSKTPPEGWPCGKYRGELVLVRASGPTPGTILEIVRQISIEVATGSKAGK